MSAAAPAADRGLANDSLPTVPGSSPEAGVLCREHDFNSLGVIVQVLTRFSRAKKGVMNERTVTR